MTEITREYFVAAGRKGAQAKWSNDVVKLQELDPDTRRAVRLILRLADRQRRPAPIESTLA